MMKILALVFVAFAGSYGWAAISSNTKQAVKQAVKPPSSILRSAGAIHGGQAGLGFSLLKVSTKVAKTNKLERVTVAIGNGALQKQEGSPGYFQIENNPQLKRVIINFPQTMNTAFNEQSLQAQFTKSPFVKSSQMLFEAEGQTTSLVLHLKKAVSIRAIPVAGNKNQTAQLMVDLFDDSLLATNSPRAPAKANSKVLKKALPPKKVK